MARSEQIASLFAAIGFRVDKASYQSIDKSLKTIENRVNRIQNSIKSLKMGGGLSDAFKGTERQATKATTAIDAFNKKASSGTNLISAYASSVNSLASAFANVNANKPSRLPKVPGESVNRPRTTPSGTGGGKGFLSGLGLGDIGGFARDFLPGLGVGWAAMKITENARQMVATQNAFSALTGSQAGGAAEMDYVRQFSDKYGFRLKTSAEGYKGILASAQGTKLQGEKSRKVFEGMQLYGAALGLDSEAMKRANTAVSQMISKGKVMSEELKGQLAEALPGAVQIFAKSMNVPVSKMFDMMKDGKVLSEEILPKAAEEMARVAKNGGALEKYLNSSVAAQNRFLSKWDDFTKKLYERSGDKAIAQLFNMMTASLPLISSALEWVIKLFGQFLQHLNEAFSLFGRLDTPIKNTIIAITALGAALKMGGWAWIKSHPLMVFLTTLFLILDDIAGWQSGKKSLFGELFGSFDELNFKLDPFFEKWDKWYNKVKEVLVGMGLLNPDKINPANPNEVANPSKVNPLKGFGTSTMNTLKSVPLGFMGVPFSVAKSVWGSAATAWDNMNKPNYIPKSQLMPENGLKGIGDGNGRIMLKVDNLHINNPVGNFDQAAKEVITAFPVTTQGK